MASERALAMGVRCPICGQLTYMLSVAGQWARGKFICCGNCRNNRSYDVAFWLEGWDAAVEHAKGD